MKTVKLAAILLAVVLAVSMTLSVADSLAAESTDVSLTLETAPLLDEDGNPVPGQLLIVGKLTTADGQGLGNVDVSFFEQVEFMGELRNAGLGSRATRATGNAAVVFQPSTAEPHVVWARASVGEDQVAVESEQLNVQVSDVTPLFEHQETPLASIRSWLSWAVGAVVIGLWVVVGAAFIQAVVGIRRAGNASGRPETAQ